MPERSGPLRRFRTLVLAALLFLSLAGAGKSIAGDGQTAEPAQPAKPAPAAEPAGPAEPAQATEPAPPDAGHEEKLTVIEKSVDEAHDLLQRNILEQAIRLDSFFGGEKDYRQRQTGYYLRLRNSVRVEKGGNLKFGISARANVVLSKISERLRLTISGDSEPDPFAPSLPEDPGNPGFDRTAQTTRIVNTELRYGLLRTPSMDLFLGAGVRLVLPPQAFLRSRFQYTYHLSDVSLLRLAGTFFVRSNDVVGETTEISLERLLDQKTLLRWASAGTASYETRGLEWGTELSLTRELSSLSAITVLGGVYGNTSIDDVMGNYRLLARYRRNFLRSWLFYELEPEVSWPRRGDGDFPTTFAFTFLLEVVLQGTAEKAN